MAVALIILAVIILAGVFLITTSSRRDRVKAMSGLSRETRKRDKSDDAMLEALEGEPVLTGRAIERAAVLERKSSGTELVPAKPAPPAVRGPVDAETLGVTRRQFFNRSIVGMFTLGLGGFGGATLGFLWPPEQTGGFGSKIRAGQLSDVLAQIATTREPVYVAEGRFYLVPYPSDALEKAEDVYLGGVLTGMQQGVTALYQKCVHLGCKVPWCGTSQWFECPCHGSKYNRVGEYKAGPAPRGLDRFAVSVEGGTVVVDTGALSLGPPNGTNTTGQEAEGPFCA